MEQASCHRVQGQVELVIPPERVSWLVSRLQDTWGTFANIACCIAKHDSGVWGMPHKWHENSVKRHAKTSHGQGSAVVGVSNAGKEQYWTSVGVNCVSSGLQLMHLNSKRALDRASSHCWA